MRASHYNIYIKLPDSDKYLLMHGYSGAVDLVRENVVEFLKRNEDQNNNKLINRELISENTLQILEKRGYLTNKTFNKEQDYIKQIAQILHKLYTPKVPGLLILPTYDCNLRCPYCVSGQLFTKKNSSTQTMSKSLVDEIYKFIDSLIPEENKNEHISITLYGGEPLLARNRELVEYIIKKAIDKKYKFRAITNGVELDHFIDLVGKDKIRSLQITLDGPPKIHNKRRIGPQYPTTFELIVKNIDLALEARAMIDIRVNVDKINLNSLSKLEEIIEGKGWYSNKDFYVEGHPVHRGGKKLDSTDITLQDLHKFHERCQENNTPFINISDYSISKIFKKGLKKESFMPFKAHNCAANTERGMYIFDPIGDIYNCWCTIGTKSYRIGTYVENKGFVIDKKEFSKWANRIVTNIPECLNCKYLFFCKGGCAYFALNTTGKINSPSCYNFDKIFSPNVIKAYQEGKLEPKENI